MDKDVSGVDVAGDNEIESQGAAIKQKARENRSGLPRANLPPANSSSQNGGGETSLAANGLRFPPVHRQSADAPILKRHLVDDEGRGRILVEHCPYWSVLTPSLEFFAPAGQWSKQFVTQPSLEEGKFYENFAMDRDLSQRKV
jgi:hypothetical protein